MATLSTLRKLLDDLRIDAKEASIPAFAVRLDVSKQTAYRVIDYQGEPDYDPSASTVDSWLRCTIGVGLDQVVTLAIAHRQLQLHGELSETRSEGVPPALTTALQQKGAADADSELETRLRKLEQRLDESDAKDEARAALLAKLTSGKRAKSRTPANRKPADGKGHR